MKISPVLVIIFLLGCAEQKLHDQTMTEAGFVQYTVLSVSTEPDGGSTGIGLSEAIERSRDLSNANKPVRIEINSGRYYLDKPIVISSEFSGTEQQPFIIGAKEGATVVLSAGEPLQLNWRPHNQHLFKAKLTTTTFDQMYINGQKQLRARYPNFNSSVAVFNGFAPDAISSKRAANWANPLGGIVHALHEGRWGGMHYEIIDRTADGELVLKGGYQNNRRSEMHEKYRYVENIFEELDAPGEWFYDSDLDELFYYPPKDLNLSEASVLVSRIDHLIEIRGSQEDPVKNIQIKGLDFVNTNQTFMKTNEPLLRSDWSTYRGGAIIIEGAEHVSVTDSRFYSLGGNAIFVSNYNRDITISGNEISDIGASAVSFVGSPDAVRSPSFEYNEFIPLKNMDMKPGPKTANYPSKSRVYNNLIHDVGRVEKQVAGVQLSMASNITVSYNSIYRVPRAGINVSEGTWGGHIIEHNDVFDTVLETGDHGAFNSWGRDRFWHPDRAVMDVLVERHPEMWKLDAQNPTIIRHNRFHCDHGWDIDLDDGSSNYRIYKNIALNGGIKLREGFNRMVENNIVLNNSFHPHVWFKHSEDIFKKNIVLVSHKPILNDHWGDEVDYNLFVNEADLKKAQALGLDVNSVFGDPKFVDATTGNYQLSDDSPGLALGFENFPMDSFGVASAHLKQKAETPDFPDLFFSAYSDQPDKEYQLLGATLKSVETLGEQSALGIPEIAGALVLAVQPDSKMATGGVRSGDVIIQVIDTVFNGNDKIITVNDLLASYQSRKWRGVLEVVISRNQQRRMLSINLVE